MKSMGKKVYIVSMDESGKLPQSLRDVVPIYMRIIQSYVGVVNKMVWRKF